MEQLIIFAILLSSGYFFGRRAEKKHYKSIFERENHWLRLPATSCKYVLEDDRDIDHCHLVNGSMVVSVDYFKRILAMLRIFFGGNVQSYETLIDRARREAILRAIEQAQGADMVIALRIETSSIGQSANRRNAVGSIEALAYGTAIFYEPVAK